MNIAPNEELSVDFADIGGHDVLVIKDRLSGWISAFRTKSKKTEAACEALEDHFYEFGLPSRITSDGGPAFQGAFTEWLRGWHINHHTTPAHHPRSNGLVERGVRSIREIFEKQDKHMSQKLLKRICFLVNSHPQRNGSGSPNEKYFRRGPRSLLPNSL